MSLAASERHKVAINEIYGPLEATLKRDQLVIVRSPSMTAKLRPEGGNKFTAEWTGMFGDREVQFGTDSAGRVTTLKVMRLFQSRDFIPQAEPH